MYINLQEYTFKGSHNLYNSVFLAFNFKMVRLQKCTQGGHKYTEINVVPHFLTGATRGQ